MANSQTLAGKKGILTDDGCPAITNWPPRAMRSASRLMCASSPANEVTPGKLKRKNAASARIASSARSSGFAMDVRNVMKCQHVGIAGKEAILPYPAMFSAGDHRHSLIHSGWLQAFRRHL